MLEEVVGSKKEKENRQQLTLCIEEVKIKQIKKHQHACLFCKVAILGKKLFE